MEITLSVNQANFDRITDLLELKEKSFLRSKKKTTISFGGRTCARADEACIYGAWLGTVLGSKPRGTWF